MFFSDWALVGHFAEIRSKQAVAMLCGLPITTQKCVPWKSFSDSICLFISYSPSVHLDTFISSIRVYKLLFAINPCIHLSINLFIFIFNHAFIYQSIPFIGLFSDPFNQPLNIYPFLHPSIHTPIYPPSYSSIYIYLFVLYNLYPSICRKTLKIWVTPIKTTRLRALCAYFKSISAGVWL